MHLGFTQLREAEVLFDGGSFHVKLYDFWDKMEYNFYIDRSIMPTENHGKIYMSNTLAPDWRDAEDCREATKEEISDLKELLNIYQAAIKNGLQGIADFESK